MGSLHTGGNQLHGDALTAGATVSTDFIIKAQLDAQGDTVVANIAALKALTIADYVSGHKVWVTSKKALYFVDRAASSVSGDDNFYVAPTTGTGMYVRQYIPVPEWQAAAINGTGLFIDPTSGDDENTGLSSGVPIKSVAEFCARMYGAEFSTIQRLTFLTGSTVAKDRIYTGFRNSSATPLIVIGTQATVVASITLTAAGDLDPLVSAGFLTNTVTNFSSLGYTSNGTRSLWAKRANTSGGATTYAALYNAHNSGGDFSVDITPQFELSSALVGAVTTQPFAAADVVSLVSLPGLPGIQADSGLFVRTVGVDLNAGAIVTGGVTSYVLGTRGSLTELYDGTLHIITGAQFTGSVTIIGPARWSPNFYGLGASGVTGATMNANASIISPANFTMYNSTMLALAGGQYMWGTVASNGWIEQCSIIFTLSNGAQAVLGDNISIGIGPGVTDACNVTHGSKLIGTEQFKTGVATFVNAAPYIMDGIAYTEAELGRVSMETMSAIVES